MKILASLRNKLTVLNVYFSRAWVAWASKYSIFFSTTTILYYNMQIFQTIFDNFLLFIIFFSIIFVVLIYVVGWLDMTRFGTFKDEKKLMISRKAYFLEPFPKEREIKTYTSLVLAKIVKKIANNLDIDTTGLEEIIDRGIYFVEETDSKILNNIFKKYI